MKFIINYANLKDEDRIFHSDGSWSEISGDKVYHSDGSWSNIVGDRTFNSDGSWSDNFGSSNGLWSTILRVLGGLFHN